jgi:hypothetical protein
LGRPRGIISHHEIQQNTARIVRIIDNMVICRTFMRPVLTVIITRVGDSIARFSQIVTAGPTSEIGGFCGFSWASTCPRSVRSVFWPAFVNALCDLGVFLCRLVRREYLSPRPWHFGMACAPCSAYPCVAIFPCFFAVAQASCNAAACSAADLVPSKTSWKPVYITLMKFCGASTSML